MKTPEATAAPPAWWRGWSRRPVATEPAAACAICGGSNSSVCAEGYDYEMGTCPNRWTFRACTACGHVQLDPRPALAELGAIYPSDYYSYNMAERMSAWVLKGKSFLDDLRLRSILRCLPRPARTFLDVGCGDGKYLDRMRARGLEAKDIHGIELDEQAVKRAAAKGYRVYHMPVEQCEEIAPGTMDVITLFHVIEHVADPNACVQKLAGMLAPGGVLAIETPNRESIDARWFARSFWGGYHIPRHWHVFSDDGLVRLLQKQGLEVVAKRYVSGHSFWLYSFHHGLAYNARHPMPRLAKFFDPLRSRVALLAVTGFDYLRAMLGARTSSMLIIARRP